MDKDKIAICCYRRSLYLTEEIIFTIGGVKYKSVAIRRISKKSEKEHSYEISILKHYPLIDKVYL